MADNLEILKQNLDIAIDPNAAPGQIFAQKHNDYVTEFINKQGKYVGFPFNVKATYNGIANTGDFFLNGALNDTNTVAWICSKLNADLNDFGIVLNTLRKGDIIHFKDFVGRSCYFKFDSFFANIDNNSNDIYQINVIAYPGNVNYTYQPTETRIGVFEVINYIKKTIPFLDLQIYKADGNGLDSLEINDIASGWITSTLFIPFGQYLGGQIDDPNNWNSSPFDFS